MQSKIRSLGLWGKRSGDKFIPHQYKTGGYNERLDLIAGLIDSDGSLTRSGFDYISKSKKLSYDVAFVCRSIGLAAYVKKCRKSSQNGTTGTYYRVSISGDCSIIPNRLTRKKAPKRKQIKRVNVTGFSVSLESENERYYGVSVDSDHLYLLGDFTVTHNSGKSHCIAAFCKEALQNWAETRILMLTHNKELIGQNAEKLREHWPNAPLGIYSAGLNRREFDQITYAGIQSVRKRAQQLGHIDLIIVDECHIISHKDEGGYRKLIKELTEINPSLRVIGFTATPFRLGHGLITDGDGLFDGLIEPISIIELIELGHLAPLRSKLTDMELDTAGVKKRGGEFVEKYLQEAVDTDEQNNQAVEETVKLAGDRKAWLFFCTGVKHAMSIRDVLRAKGITAECITGKTPKAERKEILRAFKAGEITAVTNANVLTTGFDYPGIDLIAFLRPTESKSLFCQMAGRGMRPKPHTDHCLVLDFAGVVTRHGPITSIHVDSFSKKEKEEGDEDDDPNEPPSKSCPVCKEINTIRARECVVCGEPFPIIEKKVLVLHSKTDIMGLQPTEMLVSDWSWTIQKSKSNDRDMIKITYYSPNMSDPLVSEYLCLLHDGYAQTKALKNLGEILKSSNGGTDGSLLSYINNNDNAYDLKELAGIMSKQRPPGKIEYMKNGRYYNLVSKDFTVKPTQGLLSLSHLL